MAASCTCPDSRCPPTRLHALPTHRALPAAVAVIVASPNLMPESASVSDLLRLSYQLLDATGRSAVNASGMTLRPLLRYAAGAAPPAVNASVDIQLPSCEAGDADPVSGIGACMVAVDAVYFPASGSLTATVLLQLRSR